MTCLWFHDHMRDITCELSFFHARLARKVADTTSPGRSGASWQRPLCLAKLILSVTARTGLLEPWNLEVSLVQVDTPDHYG